MAVTETFVPCCQDGCEETSYISQQVTEQEDEEEHSSSCSPFFACNTCAPSLIINIQEFNITTPPSDSADYGSGVITRLSTYHSSPFHPPRNI